MPIPDSNQLLKPAFEIRVSIQSLLFVLGGVGEGAAAGQDGRQQGFNDSGMLTFQLSFTDGTQGVFTAQAVPEPCATALLVTPAVLGVRPRRRRRR